MPNINDIKYDQKTLSNPTLVVNNIPSETESSIVQTQDQINSQSYPLSERNVSGVYIVPIFKDVVWLNYLAQKTVVKDSELFKVIDNTFKYFTEIIPIIPEKFTLIDGMFFRCASDQILNADQYTYYIMKDGKASIIPNFKTVEVMLIERGQSLLNVKILEAKQCAEIDKTGMDESDKQSQWKEEYADVTLSNIQKFKALGDNAKSAAATVAAANAESQKQIDAVVAQAAADKKAAEAAQAQAVAAKSASDAAIAQAKAAEASAKAAEAEAAATQAQADQAKAEAGAEKAAIEASKTTTK